MRAPRTWFENHWNLQSPRTIPLALEFGSSAYSFQSQCPSSSCVTWDKWPHLSELYLEVVVRLRQTGEVLGDWETHVRGFGVFGEKVSGTTHLRKGSGQQGSQEGQGTFLFHVLRFWSRGHQASAPMASRDRGVHHCLLRGYRQTQE